MKSNERAKLIEEACRLIWSSFESHLEWTYKETPEGKRFQRQCIKEYARLLSILSRLY